MPRKRLTGKRLLRLIRQKVNRALGRTREADILYVRLLEGWMSRREVALVYDKVKELAGPGAIAEVGSWKGKSTVAMGLAALRSGRDETIYAIDHHQGSPELQEHIAREGSTWPDFQATIEEAGVADYIHPLKMSSQEGASWLTREQVKLKFLLLDGAHDEESVTHDLEAFIPLLLPGGYIALDDARPDNPDTGVYVAYEKVLKERCDEVRWAGGMLLVQMPEG